MGCVLCDWWWCVLLWLVVTVVGVCIWFDCCVTVGGGCVLRDCGGCVLCDCVVCTVVTVWGCWVCTGVVCTVCVVGVYCLWWVLCDCVGVLLGVVGFTV